MERASIPVAVAPGEAPWAVDAPWTTASLPLLQLLIWKKPPLVEINRQSRLELVVVAVHCVMAEPLVNEPWLFRTRPLALFSSF